MMFLGWLATLLFAGGYFLPTTHAVITITGNEQPLINGVQQDIACNYSGQGEVVEIQWLYVVGSLEIVHTRNASGVRELVLSLTPTLELNGSQFKCRIIHPRGQRSDRTITIAVKELQHSLNITASRGNPVVAGTTLILTCVAVSNRAATLQWIDENGREISSGNGIDVSAPQTNEVTSVITLTFVSIKASHEGTYTCRCVVDELSSIETTAYSVTVQRLENSLNISASESTPVFAGTRLSLTCVAVNDMIESLHWHDARGHVISSGNGVNVSVSRINQVTSILILTFVSIKTSQAGNYSCKCEDDISTYSIHIQIPEPTVMILREPEHPTQLFTTDSLVLTCVIELIPEVDSQVIINSKWRGHTSLTDGERRVIVSNLEGDQLVYRTSVRFSSLKSSDSGSYVCSAVARPHSESENRNMIESPLRREEINISIVLRVTIDVAYDPPSDFTLPSPPYYRPASSVTLTCNAHSATGTVTFQWSSNCTDCFASSSTSQTITDSILQANDAGVHTCTAVDSIGNSGSSSTEMELIGAGLYVKHSHYFDEVAVPNNSLIVQKSRSCRYCKVDVYCHSNSSSQDVGDYVFPNGNEYFRSNSNYYYTVGREGYSGVRIRSYSSRTPSSWGIFTCRIPDSEGNIIETSIGIYYSMPSAPAVYSSDYSDWSDADGDLLGTVECLTQNSPPTNVTCTRDGVDVDFDGDSYQLIQSVIDRQHNSKYNNSLLIRNAIHLAGTHTYNCTITNVAGSTECIVNSTLDTQPVVDIDVSSHQAVYSKPFILDCRASLNSKVASQLLRYLVLDWVRVDGQDVCQVGGVTVEEQQFFPSSNTTTRYLVFNPLVMAHGGDYRCEAKLILPEDAGSFNTTLDYHLNVMNWTIIQLNFGPMLHCVHWYEDQRIAEYLERDIQHALVECINHLCQCNFQLSQLSQGEFSCRGSYNGHVTYRVRLEGTSDTLPIPELLELIQTWMKNDGTFLYTYHAKTRLGLDPLCPLEVASFSQHMYQGPLGSIPQPPRDEL